MFNSHLDDHQRPNLVTPWKEGTNYINAVYVHVSTDVNMADLTENQCLRICYKAIKAHWTRNWKMTAMSPRATMFGLCQKGSIMPARLECIIKYRESYMTRLTAATVGHKQFCTFRNSNPRLWVYDIQNIINIYALLQLRTGCIFVHIPDSNQSGKRSSISDDEICIDLWWSLLLSNIIYVVNYVRKWSHILLLCIIKK